MRLAPCSAVAPCSAARIITRPSQPCALAAIAVATTFHVLTVLHGASTTRPMAGRGIILDGDVVGASTGAGCWASPAARGDGGAR
jgi:hypothetical protein